MVDLGANTMTAKEGVYAESKVECCAASRHRLDFALWGENKDFTGKQVQLDRVEEVHGVGLRIVKNLLDGAEPLVQFGLVLSVFFLFLTLFVFPVGRESLLGNLVHAVTAYLHLNPSALFRHQCDVQCLIAIGFRMNQPVTQTVGMCFVDFRQFDVDVETFVDLLLATARCEDDADSKNVVNLIERHVLVLHLVPNGIRCFHTLFYLIGNAQSFQGILDGTCELVEKLVTRGLRRGQFLLNGSVFLWMLKTERQVLEFRLDFIQAKTVGQRRIDVKRLTGNLVLFVGRLRLQGAHVVQTVGNLD